MKNYQIAVRMNGMISERVDRIADRMGVNRATVIRYALDRMLPEIEREGIVLRPSDEPKSEPAGGEA
jgi:predicted DNA-binding protein